MNTSWLARLSHTLDWKFKNYEENHLSIAAVIRSHKAKNDPFRKKNELQAQKAQTNIVTLPTSTYLHLLLSCKMLKWPWDKKLLYLFKQGLISGSHMPALRPIYTQAAWTLATNKHWKWVAEPTQTSWWRPNQDNTNFPHLYEKQINKYFRCFKCI